MKHKRKNNFKIKIIWIIILVSIWEIVARLYLVNPLLLPSFSSVMIYLIKGIISGNILLQASQSVMFVLMGLIVSGIIGIIIVYIDYFYPIFRGLFEVLSSVLHPLPGVAVLPVIILWVGIGKDAVFIVILHATLWSFYVSLKSGFLSIEKSHIEAAQNNGATKSQLFKYVLLPGSKEAIMSGLRIGWSRGWRALISAEMIFGAISSIGGIGWYMYEKRAFGDIKGTYSGILVVALIGIVVEQVLFSRLSKD